MIDHILAAYHRPLSEELGRLEMMARKVLSVHGDKDPERLRELVDVYVRLEDELIDHMAKEEQVLFPMIRRGQGAMADGPVAVMLHEHDDAGVALRRLRAYVGALEIPSFEPGDVVLQFGPPPWSFDYAGEEALATDVVGGRLGLLTPVEGVTVRISGFTGKVERSGQEAERVVCVGVSGEWTLDWLQLRGEWFRADEIARNITGVRIMQNRLRVAPPRPVPVG